MRLCSRITAGIERISLLISLIAGNSGQRLVRIHWPANQAVRSLVETSEFMRKARDTGAVLNANSLCKGMSGVRRPNSAESLCPIGTRLPFKFGLIRLLAGSALRKICAGVFDKRFRYAALGNAANAQTANFKIPYLLAYGHILHPRPIISRRRVGH